MIYFVKPRQHYWDCGDEECLKTHSGSYTDYYRLVELAEFSICYVDEIDWQSENTYINIYFCFPNQEKFPKDRKCKMIYWFLERDIEVKRDKRFDEVWISDRWAAKQTGYKYVILGTDIRLRMGEIELPKKFDFIHLSYETDRRARVYNFLRQTNQTIAPNAWGQERDGLLRQSKAMLAVHQDETPMIEPLRYALASVYHLPILAEYSHDFYPFKIAEKLPGLIRLYWLKPKFPLDSDYQFKNNVLKALEIK